MKVLLIGEFSALHKYLKEGLLEQGVADVKLFSYGDGWKQISGSDYIFRRASSNKIYNFYKQNIEEYQIIKQLSDFDVVQLINPIVFSPFVNCFLVDLLKKNNRLFSLVAAGGDLVLSQAYNKGLFDYYVYDYDKSYIDRYYKFSAKSLFHKYNNYKVLKLADCVIPSLYEYSIGYKTFGYHNKLTSVVPFPININTIKYQDNVINNKIVFFHGLNRELSKGTIFIREALTKLKNNYPNDVEIIIDGHLPFEKYLDIINRANVVVDQCCGYGYGINACISMAQGKIVMSGCRQETLDAFGISNSPIINTKPDVDYLYKQMIHILENKKSITSWGYQSRKYVEELHDYKKVAKKYLTIWKERFKMKNSIVNGGKP